MYLNSSFQRALSRDQISLDPSLSERIFAHTLLYSPPSIIISILLSQVYFSISTSYKGGHLFRLKSRS